VIVNPDYYFYDEGTLKGIRMRNDFITPVGVR
jgi:hypothetical protein